MDLGIQVEPTVVHRHSLAALLLDVPADVPHSLLCFSHDTSIVFGFSTASMTSDRQQVMTLERNRSIQ